MTLRQQWYKGLVWLFRIFFKKTTVLSTTGLFIHRSQIHLVVISTKQTKLLLPYAVYFPRQWLVYSSRWILFAVDLAGASAEKAQTRSILVSLLQFAEIPWVNHGYWQLKNILTKSQNKPFHYYSHCFFSDILYQEEENNKLFVWEEVWQVKIITIPLQWHLSKRWNILDSKQTVSSQS